MCNLSPRTICHLSRRIIPFAAGAITGGVLGAMTAGVPATDVDSSFNRLGARLANTRFGRFINGTANVYSGISDKLLSPIYQAVDTGGQVVTDLFPYRGIPPNGCGIGCTQNLFELEAGVKLTQEEVLRAIAEVRGLDPSRVDAAELLKSGIDLAEIRDAVNLKSLRKYGWRIKVRRYQGDEFSRFQSEMLDYSSAIITYPTESRGHGVVFNYVKSVVYDGARPTSSGQAGTYRVSIDEAFSQMGSDKIALYLYRP